MSESLWACIEKLMENTIRDSGFSIFAPFGRKHGSWETTFSRSADHGEESEHTDGIWRFISLALTEDKQSYIVEVWVLAEKEPNNREQAKYYRRMIRQFPTGDQVRFFKEHHDVTEDFRRTLTTSLKQAADIVLGCKDEDLIASYSRLIPARPRHSVAVNEA